ncbi:hypothetical protein BH23BAC3_BH23BAC3_14080 [soil metagenome]
MNKNKSNSEHTDPENTKGGIADNGQPASNEASGKFASGNYSVKMEDLQFAKTEMEKLTQSSSVKLGKMKTRISEYQAAKAISNEAASQTEIGKLLNNPDVWGVIANKILS